MDEGEVRSLDVDQRGDDGLDEKERALIEAQLTGVSRKEAARIAGWSERSARRKFNEDARFRAIYEDAKRQLREDLEGSITARSHEAVETIARVMREGDLGQQLRAATILLDKEAKLQTSALADLLRKIESTLGDHGNA
jgi:hypothetical protein